MKEPIVKNKLYNPDGESFYQPIVGGDPSGLLALNLGKYSQKKWFGDLYAKMCNDIWFPERVSMAEDTKQFPHLIPEFQRAYMGILSFLTYLDSIQTYNPFNFTKYISAGEINFLIVFQAFQEAVHAKSYSYIDESVLGSIEEKKELYDLCKTDPILKKRNDYIASLYTALEDNPNSQTFMDAIIANYILEGLYFYNGFKFFYALEERGLMKGTADVIRLINRDEISHLILYKNIIKEIAEVKPEWVSEKRIFKLFTEAVEQEEIFSIDLLGDCFGFNEETITKYTRFLANRRLKDIGFVSNPFSEYTENPYKHFDDALEGGDVVMEENFFTSGISTYNKADNDGGWAELE